MKRFRKATGRERLATRRAKSRLSLQKVQNAGAAIGMMAMSGRDAEGFSGQPDDAFKRASGMCLGGDISSAEFDDIL